MLEYFYTNNFTDAYNALKSDSGTEYTPDPRTKYAGLLEKKWTSVLRLQKKVLLHYLLPRLVTFRFE
jgi:platelet-activating factor acetylhydrolase IB subunit alpha